MKSVGLVIKEMQRPWSRVFMGWGVFGALFLRQWLQLSGCAQSMGLGSVWGCCCKEEHPAGTGGVLFLQPREKEGMRDSKVLRNGYFPYSLARKTDPCRACSAGCSTAQRAAGLGGVTGSHISFPSHPPPGAMGAANRRGAIGHQRLPQRSADFCLGCVSRCRSPPRAGSCCVLCLLHR